MDISSLVLFIAFIFYLPLCIPENPVEEQRQAYSPWGLKKWDKTGRLLIMNVAIQISMFHLSITICLFACRFMLDRIDSLWPWTAACRLLCWILSWKEWIQLKCVAISSCWDIYDREFITIILWGEIATAEPPGMLSTY